MITASKPASPRSAGIFKWWVETECEGDVDLHARLTAEAAVQHSGEDVLLALDWNNGNRTILVDPRLSVLVVGQTLHKSRANIHNALIEATAFGARAIIERLRDHGVLVRRVVCAGGVAEKNSTAHADLRGRNRLPDARGGDGESQTHELEPRPENQRTYDEVYALYRKLHDAFGGVNRSIDLSDVMKCLIDLEERTLIDPPAGEGQTAAEVP